MLVGVVLIFGANFLRGQEPGAATPVALAIRSAGAQVELSWPATMTNDTQRMIFPDFQVESSTDLEHWQPAGELLHGIEYRFGPQLTLGFDQQTQPTFYRVRAQLGPDMPPRLRDGGGEVFGYTASFDDELARIGQLPVADFATNGAQIPYLPQLTWDPTTARFWTNFDSADPFYLHYGGTFPGEGTNLPYTLRLNDEELAIFRTNGFVASERLGSATFGDAYYRIFNADLPVFISADAVLHAWHRSFQSMLAEFEYEGLAPLLDTILNGMSSRLPGVWQAYGQGPMRESILDADYFLTVARSLSAGQQRPSTLGDAGVNQQVAVTLTAIQAQAVEPEFPIFGSYRGIDFSQFKVRGHYEAYERLGRYFQAMMWCARIDLRLATFYPNCEDDIRQLGTAAVLDYLSVISRQIYNWQSFEQVTQLFFGNTDSMTLGELEGLLENDNLLSYDWMEDVWNLEIPDRLTLTNLQTSLLTGKLGVQAIHSSLLYSPLSPQLVELPRSFTLLGQKFVVDSWAFSQTVFDRVHWEPSDGVNVIFGKVIHRKPSGLDMAFSVLANDQVVPEIVARILNTNGVPFRDGLPYQHNLLAVRRVIDARPPALWTNTIYGAWLAALRALSAPTTDPAYPEAMRTRAWAMKNLNTQLASWTELRHDTVLYAKQSYTEPVLCAYPAGYVEPHPEFWQKMKLLASTTASIIGHLPIFASDEQMNSRQVTFLNNFNTQVGTLQSIAQKELAAQPLSAAETEFLKNTIEREVDYVGIRRWNGWYPSLFYTNSLPDPSGGSPWGIDSYPNPGCDEWDPLVTDVHTDLPDEIVGDPGAVIHEAVGNVPMLLVAVDNGPDYAVYAGPVFSHYEFEVPGVKRLSDSDWKATLRAGEAPLPPDWTRSYFVPGSFTMPPGY